MIMDRARNLTRRSIEIAITVALSFAGITEVLSQENTAEKWPAYINGQYVVRNFRFKPTFVQYRPLPTRSPSTLVVFGIKRADIPADYFTVGYRDGSEEERRVKEAIDSDGGYITVTAHWVNPAESKREWKGSPQWWADGRLLLGELVTKSRD